MSEKSGLIIDEQERKQKAQKPAQEKQPKPKEVGDGDRDVTGYEKAE